MSDLIRDLRFAARTLLKTPGFSAVTILVLALGIGATTAMFGVIDALLLQPLPFRDPARVMILEETQPQASRPLALTAPDFHAFHDRATSFESLAALTGGRATLLDGDTPEQLNCLRVSTAFFRVLDGRPVVGRVFDEGDRQADAPVVLGAALWRRRFGADPAIVGRALNLGDRPHVVIGVMPDRYVEGNWADLWMLDDFPIQEKERGLHHIGAVGRLAPGVSAERASAELGTIAAQLAAERPETNATVRARISEFHAWNVDYARQPTLMLLGAITLVLLIACANVAGLVLARASTRRAEIAVRVALGATRGRVVRQLVTESLVLALLGGLLGLLFASWGVGLVLGGLAPNYAYAEGAGVGGRAVLFTLGCSFATAVGFGLAPALEASGWDVHAALKEGGARATPSRRAEAARGFLVAAEIALAFALLAGAGVLGKSFAHLATLPRGFDPRGVHLFEAQLQPARYPTDEKRAAFIDAVLGRLRAAPGVTAAAAMSAPPVLSGAEGFFEIEGRPPWPRGAEPAISFQVASPGYDAALGVALRDGRFFADADRAGATRVAVVNETMARRFFPGERAMGKRLRIDWGDEGHFDADYSEIVGVYADTRNRGLTRDPVPEVLFPIAQHPDDGPTFAVRVQNGTDAGALVRGAVREVDPTQAISGKRWARGVRHTSYEDLVDLTIGLPRFHATILGAFAALALVLTMVGIFGVVSYSVELRTREFAVRLAFGARPGDLVRLVLLRSGKLVAAGLGAGLVIAALTTRLLQSLVFGVSPLDPAALAGAAVLLAGVALGAGVLPARRAARVSPMVALRAE